MYLQSHHIKERYSHLMKWQQKFKKKTSDINKQVKSLKKPINYSTEIKHLKDKNQKYSTSVKQLKQITNPSNTFVESRLKEIDTISDV